jgi:hypothetical protein
MARKHRPKTAPQLATEAGGAAPPVWERDWFPAALLALLAGVYFSGVLAGKVVFGSDIGTDYHRTLAKLDYDRWIPVMGGFPEYENLRWRYFPLNALANLASSLYNSVSSEPWYPLYQRLIAWRYLLMTFVAGWGMSLYLRQVGTSRWPAFWGGLAYLSAPTFLAFPYAGHYAKMTVIALFPLMCLSAERILQRKTEVPRWEAVGWVALIGLGLLASISYAAWAVRAAFLALLLGAGILAYRRPSIVGSATWGLVYPAALSALIALGAFSPQLQVLYYALAGVGFCFLWRLCELYQAERNTAQALRRTGLFAAAVVLGLGLGAEGLVPSSSYARNESKRAGTQDATGAGRSAAEQLEFARSWSLHPEEAGSLVVPEFGGFYDPQHQENYYWGRNALKLNSEYFGALVLLLAILAVTQMRRSRWALGMGVLFTLSLAYALGGHTPVHWVFYHLMPGAKVLRTPGVVAFLFAFAACCLAARGLDHVLGGSSDPVLQKRVLVTGGVLAGLALLVALAPQAATNAWISLVYNDIGPQKRELLAGGFGWLARGGLFVSLVVAAGTLLLYLRLRQQLGTGLLVLGLSGLALFDTWRIDRLFLRYEDPAQHADIRSENPRTIEFMKRDGRPFRVFPVPGYDFLDQPGYHLYGKPNRPEQSFASVDYPTITSVTGFHDLPLRRYDRILREISPVSNLFEAKYYQRQQIPYTEQALVDAVHPLLDLVNARYLASPKQLKLELAGITEVYAAENLRVYENPSALPWFYLVSSCQVIQGEEALVEALKGGQVDLRQNALLEEEPPAGLDASTGAGDGSDSVEQLEYNLPAGRILLQSRASGPRLLVVSENYHPYWGARVDGQDAKVFRANYLWQAVYVPAGEHQVELLYTSPVVTWSRRASLLSLLAVLGIAGWTVWRSRGHAAGDRAGPG